MSNFNHPTEGRSMRRGLTIFLMVVFLSSRSLLMVISNEQGITQTEAQTNETNPKKPSSQTEQVKTDRMDGSWIIPAVLAIVIYKLYEPNFTPEAKAKRQLERNRQIDQEREWQQERQDAIRQENWDREMAKSRQ